MMRGPCLGVCAHPSDSINDLVVELRNWPMENRLMMRDTVSESPDGVETAMNLPAAAFLPYLEAL